jgi:acyl carrier protein
VRRFSIIFLSFFILGCDRKEPSSSPPPAPGALPAIQKIIANQLKRSASDIRPDATFGALGADDLDLVEIVMATEDALNISIDDDGLTKAAGATHPDKLVGSLTVRAFAAFADGAPRRQPPPQNNEPNDGGLRATQVGSYGELSKLPNPRGHELVFVPSLEALMMEFEQKAGRKLTSNEQAVLKTNAVVIAMPPEDAEKFRQERLERQTTK